MNELVQIILGLVIGWRSLEALRLMTRRTHHGIRVLHIILATAGAGMAVGPFYPNTITDTPKLTALAAYLALQLVSRRRDAL